MNVHKYGWLKLAKEMEVAFKLGNSRRLFWFFHDVINGINGEPIHGRPQRLDHCTEDFKERYVH